MRRTAAHMGPRHAGLQLEQVKAQIPVRVGWKGGKSTKEPRQRHGGGGRGLPATAMKKVNSQRPDTPESTDKTEFQIL